MIWQDVVMMLVGFTFAFFLIPSIRSKQKPARSSCILTALGMFVLTVSVATLGLWLTAIANALTTVAWTTLTVQTWKAK